MLLAIFLSALFSEPTKPHGWEKRTDARPYLSQSVNGKPVQSEPLREGEGEERGWEVHVRTAPGKGDDWRAKVMVSHKPISFRSHASAWPSDDWVYYQMLGRVHVEGGKHMFGVAFATADAGIGCFADFRVGGATVIQVDVKTFFAKRRDGFKGRDELTFAGPVELSPGVYDGVLTIGCHPGKMGEQLELARIRPWKESKFIVLAKRGNGSVQPLDVHHVVKR